MSKYIPLLSPKPFAEFSPEEFHEYVKSLYYKPEPRKSVKEKKAYPFTFRVNKQGNLVLSIKREPKFLYDEELCWIGQKTGIALSKILEKMKKAGIEYKHGAVPGGLVVDGYNGR